MQSELYRLIGLMTEMEVRHCPQLPGRLSHHCAIQKWYIAVFKNVVQLLYRDKLDRQTIQNNLKSLASCSELIRELIRTIRSNVSKARSCEKIGKHRRGERRREYFIPEEGG